MTTVVYDDTTPASNSRRMQVSSVKMREVQGILMLWNAMETF
jgi:hypothetical protein